MVHHDFFVKLDFEIAVDQQTKDHDRTSEGVPGVHRCPRDRHDLICQLVAQFCQITLTSSYKFYQNWLSYEQSTICPYLDIWTYAPYIWAYVTNIRDFGP